jgi:ABC-2 type transport system permease protein
MILYVSVLMWGQMVMMGVIEEKNSRVVEMVVSSVTPVRLLAGKLLGIGAAGLTQYMIWALSGAALLAYGAPMMAASQKMVPEVTPLVGISFVVFFLLGFFLYSLLYAAVGAAVNSVQEAQSLIQPVILPQILAIMFLYVVIQSPGSGLSVALSLIPFTAPTLMFLRIVVLTPPWWQIALSIVLCLATIAALTWVVARIYRVGILMYGKKPTLPEILRWVRTA